MAEIKQKQYKNEKRHLGDLNSIKIDIDSPFKSKNELELNKLNLITGMNGTGKTFLLINCWAATFITNGLIKGKLDLKQKLEFAQYIYDNCFDDQNINGKISYIYKTGEEIHLEFEKGKVINLTYTSLADIENIKMVRFMSAPMRTFESISMYLKLRKYHSSLTEAQIMEQMVKDFKIYDVVYVENLIAKMPFSIPKDRGELLKESYGFEEELVTMDIDKEKGDFFTIDTKGNKVYTKTYGKGHQSILNMFIGSL